MIPLPVTRERLSFALTGLGLAHDPHRSGQLLVHCGNYNLLLDAGETWMSIGCRFPGSLDFEGQFDEALKEANEINTTLMSVRASVEKPRGPFLVEHVVAADGGMTGEQIRLIVAHMLGVMDRAVERVEKDMPVLMDGPVEGPGQIPLGGTPTIPVGFAADAAGEKDNDPLSVEPLTDQRMADFFGVDEIVESHLATGERTIRLANMDKNGYRMSVRCGNHVAVISATRAKRFEKRWGDALIAAANDVNTKLTLGRAAVRATADDTLALSFDVAISDMGDGLSQSQLSKACDRALIVIDECIAGFPVADGQ